MSRLHLDILLKAIRQAHIITMLFCQGCNIKGGAKSGIHFTYSSDGRPSGECFVELVSLEDMNKWVNVGRIVPLILIESWFLHK